MKNLLRHIGVLMIFVFLVVMAMGCSKKFVRGTAVSGTDPEKIPLEAEVLSSVGAPKSFSLSQDRDKDKMAQGGGVGFSGLGETIDENLINPREEGTGTGDLLETRLKTTHKDVHDDPIGIKGASSRPGDISPNRGIFAHNRSGNKGVTPHRGLRDVFFEFDNWRLTPESKKILEETAAWLETRPQEQVTIEGHCDERGTQAYNLVLSEKRGAMVQQYLGYLGVSANRFVVVPYGKNKPACRQFTETCFQANRRAHLIPDEK